MIEFSEGCYRLRGPVTVANVEQVQQQAAGMFDGPQIVVDLSGVTEADSSAVSLLLQWGREAAARGRTIRFQNPNTNLRTLISLYEVDELLPGT
jgi:phospholipid transport system transporter-binding protein